MIMVSPCGVGVWLLLVVLVDEGEQADADEDADEDDGVAVHVVEPPLGDTRCVTRERTTRSPPRRVTGA
jgi:hypothetical protein